MIKFTQIFIQQPRNTPNSVSVPYCQSAPASPLLSGLFQCQFQGASTTTFVGGLTVGAPGTVPFGLRSLSPLGSCPANRSGPIADGTQLVNLTQDPGIALSPNNSANVNGTATSSIPAVAATTSIAEAPPVAASTTFVTTAAAIAASPSASASNFHLQNGLDAQKLNAQFQTLTANSSCTEGEQACIGTSFAQCVAGLFVITPCAAGTVCAALPLVNEAGTSITCDTSADAAARIAATGATGVVDGSAQSTTSSLSGSDSASSESDSDSDDSGQSTEIPAAIAASAAAPASSATGFQVQNGLDAQKPNAQFQTLTTNSSCTEGEQACIGASFAQCVSGSFALTPCSAGTICAALPLVNKAGTSIACDTSADVAARISAAGVTGGITGI
ncbi:hypothetical protein B0H11DRAFT_1982359 [Mycena galericulata]|nr:hypothetical protein B0H11DRAFT_1982359 [Mycena galericulata]